MKLTWHHTLKEQLTPRLFIYTAKWPRFRNPSDYLLQPRPSNLPSFFCSLCLVDCCYQHSYQQHLSGKGHQQRMEEQARLDAVPDLYNSPIIIQSDLCNELSHTPICIGVCDQMYVLNIHLLLLNC